MKNNSTKIQPKLMSNYQFWKPRLVALVATTLVLVFAAQPVLAAKHAAKVIYSFGDVKADSKSGSRGLKKGDMVYSGETVSTLRGRAQIKFTDGGFASLQPNTDYEINEYKFEGKADGKERSFLSLLKGSVRLVTGVIGKANRKNFRIRTAVATIGIRGTQGTLSHDPSTNVTVLKGHGGEWTLDSGSFFGPVPAGQSYSCNGVSCSSIAGTRTRAEVSRGSGKRSQKKQAYQQGNQTDDDGRNCDLGGGCAALTVEVEQHGSFAGEDGEEGLTAGTDFLEGLGVVSLGDKPVAFVSDGKTDGDYTINIIATDISAVEQAIAGVNDGEGDADDSGNSFLDEATEFLAELDEGLLAQLESNPASVAEEDFTTTDEGVTLGRIWQGNVYVASKNLATGEFDERIDTLRNFQSLHFVYGDDIQDLTFEGVGYYALTAATFPTAVDGSMIGTMPTSGFLSWDFLTGTGDVMLSGIVFDGMDFTISGSIGKADIGDRANPSINSVFTEVDVNATYLSGGLSMTAPAVVDGNFFTENGDSAPQAAGLTYGVDYLYPFVGAAAFGLGEAPEIVTEEEPVVIVTDTTIKYALNHLDTMFPPGTPGSYSNGDDQFPMGTPLNNFSAANGDTFSEAGSTIAESGNNGGVSWARFSGPYSFTAPGAVLGNQLEDFHAIKTDYTATDAVITSTTGTVLFDQFNGTSPTLLFDSGGGSGPYNQALGSLTKAEFSANFTTGTMDSIDIRGDFPTLGPGSFTLLAGPSPFSAGFASATGDFTDDGTTGCMATCTGVLSGNINYGFVSDMPEGPITGVISSYNAGGTGSTAFDISGVVHSTPYSGGM